MRAPQMLAPQRSKARAHLRRRSPKPRRFRDLPDGAWPRIAKRTFDHFRSDGVTNLAAALTYRAVLSLFPGLIALVALLAVVGQYPQTYRAILRIVSQIAPADTVQTVSGPIEHVITNKGGAGALLGGGLLVTLWAASGYIGALSWSMNVIWEAPRGRSWYRQIPFNLAVTVVALVVATALLVGFVVSGPVAAAVGRELHIGQTAVDVWQYAKWPVMALVWVNAVAVLYYLTPNVHPPPARWITPGALLALVVWLAITFGFALYVTTVGSFGSTYGTLGAIVTFLVWTWLGNIAMLLGAELDSEIERERQLAAGLPAEEQLQMRLRQADAPEDDDEQRM